MTPICERIRQISEHIAAVAQRAGREPGLVRLMAVSKTVPPELVRAAMDICFVKVFLFLELK